jgi:PKD repeat protein
MNAYPWSKRLFWFSVFALFALCLWLAPQSAQAAYPFASPLPPPNDNFADAEAVALPTAVLAGTTAGATVEVDEPQSDCAPFGQPGSLWYKLTPETATGVLFRIESPDAIWTLYRGTQLASLQQLTCSNPWDGGRGFLLEAGTTYYVQVAGYSGTYAGPFTLFVEPAVPYAWIYTYQPNPWVFTDIQFSSGAADPLGQWFKSYAWNFGDGTTAEGSFVFHAYTTPGRYTVTLVVTTADDRTATATTEVNVESLPPISAWISYSPYNPSTLDTVEFWTWINDPAYRPITSYLWDFGDGATATDAYAYHRYLAEGAYKVSLTVTTDDGRTATAAADISVENHDVAIVKVGVPNSARAFQTKAINVGVSSKYRNETVQVTLYKSVVGSYDNFVGVGVSQQLVRAEGANKSTQFTFNYTFTPDDVRAGTITFKAVALIPDKRDMQEANNTYISLPVKMGGGKLTGAADEQGADAGSAVQLFLPAVSGD